MNRATHEELYEKVRDVVHVFAKSAPRSGTRKLRTKLDELTEIFLKLELQRGQTK